MKKLIAATFAFLVLIPCVSHSMDDDQNERGAPKIKVKAPPPKNQNPRPGGFKYGKFVGTDKRDVAIFQDPSHDSMSTRFMNVFGSWWKTPSSPQKSTKE